MTHLGYGLNVILHNSGGSNGSNDAVEEELWFRDNLGSTDEGEQLIEYCSEIVWSAIKQSWVKTNVEDH